jgi:uncharacterized iron-regulated protein
MTRTLRLCLSLLLAFPSGLALIATAQEMSYTPQRVYHSGDKRFSDFEAMLAELARADVILVGEQHDDPATHRLELAILEGLARRRAAVILSLEMFERDVQAALDDYLAGRLGEAEFLKVSRPWPRYASDYRLLVEFARLKGWRVIAGNVPRRYASQVARTGLPALDALPPEERGLIAQQISCPADDYFKRFAEQMASHPGASSEQRTPNDPQAQSEQRARTERFYQAQCIKDETMAESIANAYLQAADPKPLIVHYNGAFHSDYRLGTAARAQQRLPKSRVRVVTVIPVDDLDTIKADDYRKRGDYVIFTLKPARKAKAAGT